MKRLVLFNQKLKKIIESLPFPDPKSGEWKGLNSFNAHAYLLGCDKKGIVDTIEQIYQSGNRGCTWVPSLTVDDITGASLKILAQKRQVCGIIRITSSSVKFTDNHQIYYLLSLVKNNDFFMLSIGVIAGNKRLLFDRRPSIKHKEYLLESTQYNKLGEKECLCVGEFQYIELEEVANVK